jgi:phosphoserine phosphatase
MNDKNIKAVILDLDQTLTVDQGSWLRFTTLLGADFKVHLDIFNRFKAGELTYPDAKKELIELWKSVNTLERKSIVEIFSKIELRAGALEAVSYLKSKYKLCVISGAINIFVDVISAKLGIEDKYSSTKFIFDESDVLVDFQYKLNRGEDKVAFFHDFCSKCSIEPQECAAIGDGESDMPIFKEAGLPILFIAAETNDEQKSLVKCHLKSWEDISEIL